ncbi:ATP-binding cassette subfamily C protein CydD [Kribbella sp. VKM Ac-2571]|uniref:thiol reductant ABC exporter subunit CydD n=1 Tax=Kribbella sp. VKM Ac-2571 TaxID=2512222 RepID=UPI00105D7F30|nr:thiol reductant ABC exporter subunit CydD [Kribbella sp. VKM Ac-2571]TDO48326.1 ATP-binding cassette subfamily C protein CydD [Kribbella sp. VKM Ac-2571]
MPAVDRRLLRHTRSTRTFLVLSAVIGTAQAVLILLQAWLLAGLIADAFLGGLDLTRLRGPLAALATTLIGRAALFWVAEIVAQRCSAAVKSELRMRFLDKIVALGPRWLTGERSGELTTLATRGIDALDDYFSKYLPQLVLVGVVPLVVAARMLTADWLSAVIVVVTLPLIPIFMVLVGLTTKAATARQWATLQALAHHFLDVLAGIGTLKVFGRSRAQVETIRRLADRQRRTTLATLRIAFLSSLVLELVATLSVALVAVSVGLRLVEGRLDLKTALLVLILAPEAYLPLRLLGTHYHASAEGLAAADELFEVIEQDTPAKGNQVADPIGEIVLRDVTVRSREARPLDDVSVVIPPGRVTGVVGPSGCGKSTLLGLLLGTISPDRGQVLAGGVDLAKADLERWRRDVAWMGQAPVLFAGTVADNISLGTRADELAVRRAAGTARVDVPLDLVLGERGDGVSAGQRRRIALARAILRDAPLLLLDEPTESVDPDTERALLESLPAAFAGRTVVLVTHRPALLDLCDHIVHLDRTAMKA